MRGSSPRMTIPSTSARYYRRSRAWPGDPGHVHELQKQDARSVSSVRASRSWHLSLVSQLIRSAVRSSINATPVCHEEPMKPALELCHRKPPSPTAKDNNICNPPILAVGA